MASLPPTTTALLATSSVLLLLLLQVADAAPRKEIPSFIHVCKRNDPHLEDCVINTLDKLRPKLASGIPEMNVPSIDPLIIPELVIMPAPSFRAIGKEVKVFGGKDFKITRLRISMNDTALEFLADIFLPKLSFVSDYEVEGRILTLPLSGKGPLTANLTDVTGTLHLSGTITKRKGGDYLRFGEGETKLDVKSPISIRLENLFNGDKTLGEATNRALNDNGQSMKEVVFPVAERVVSEFALDSANKIAINFPLDQLLPFE